MAVSFGWWDRHLELFDHEYNTTRLNERAVEIPIALTWLADRVLADGVEVGNVLSHYGFPAHRVVDLYETGADVDNIDVFDLEGPFEWIVSISTLEHVGDDRGDPSGPMRAIEHLESLLEPGGAMLVTIPGGHNRQLDDFLAGGAGTTRAATLVRSGGSWVQTSVLQFFDYGSSTRWAESVWIGEWGQQWDP